MTGRAGRRLAGAPAGSGLVAGIAASALLIAALTVLARAAGFGRIFVFAGSVGAGCTGTAYAAANQIPNVLFEVVAGGALAGAVVPVIASALAGGSREDADRIASALLTWTLVLLVPVAVALAALAHPIAEVVLGGDRTCPQAVALGARMLVVFAPQVVLYGVGIVLTGVLQAHRKFAFPAVAPLLSSLVVVAAYLLFGALAGGEQSALSWIPDRGEELVLSAGTTLGVVALSLPLLWPVLRTGTRLRPVVRFPPGVGRRVVALAGAGVATLIAQQVAVVVTVLLATRVGGTGALNVVQYVQAVYLLPYAVLAVPLATAAFPELSRHAAVRDGAGYARTAARTSRSVLAVALLGAALLVAVAPAVQTFFGELDRVGGAPLAVLAEGLVASAGGLVGWALVAHVGRALYAVEAGRAAATSTALGWAAVVAGSLAAVAVLQARGRAPVEAAVVGIGWGSTLGMTLAGVLLVTALRRTAGPAATAGLARTLLAAGGAAAVAGVGGRFATDAVLGLSGPGMAGGSAAAIAGSGVVVVVLAAVLRLLAPSELPALLPRRRHAAPADANDHEHVHQDQHPHQHLRQREREHGRGHDGGAS